MRRQTHGFRRVLRGHAFHLKQNPPRPHNRNPVVGRAFTFAHTGFGGLFRYRLVRKQADPDFAATLDKTGHGDAAGFDLPVGNPARLEDLVQRLSKEILSESVRVRFQEEMLKEIPKLTQPPTDSQHKPETGASVTSEKDTNGRGAHSSGEKPGITSDAAATQKSHEQLPSELWEIVREKLREAMGPMASFVLHDDIRALGETPESFPAARFEELVKQLSKEVLTDSLRQQFEKEMQEIRRSNKYHI